MEASNTAIRGKSSFLAKVSHEIRTPLNAILGITEIQLQNDMLSYETVEAFGKIYSAGFTLLGIINDILDLSRIEAGKVKLMPTKYDVASLINDTVQLNLVRIGSKPITFTLHVDEDMPAELFGDELRIKQILNNLLSNALKYTSEGEVALSISAEHKNDGDNSEVTLVCRISDTGEGMTAEQVDRLFDEYSRFYVESNNTVEGIGLGMTITRQLVLMMNGDIDVESVPGKGSAFTVRLPQDLISVGRLGKETADSLRQFKASIQQYKKTQHFVREPMPYGSVLIVDDLETNLYVARGLLAPYGLSIDCALSGFEAIDKIRNGKEYDIVFMDHMMPKMDGVATVKNMRSLGYNRPIVALTANAVVGQSEILLESGFDGFISKPINVHQLNTLLNRMIRDTQPPGVVEAARRQMGWQHGDDREPPAVDQDMARVFVRDAEKAVATLEAIYTNQFRRDDDAQLFVINVHAMKSALANIGELRLAAAAHELEQTGRKRDIPAMSAGARFFLNALREVIEKIRPQEEECESADEDLAYLREKLLVLQTACVEYNKKPAKDALAGLRQKKWSRPTKEKLNLIAECLLHSDFQEASDVAEKIIRLI